jgi:hypothetical protein
MDISSNTLTNLIKAVETIGEKEVNNILESLTKRDLIVMDEVVDLCCKKLDINKSFLKVKNNRVKTDLLSTIVYVLRKNGINSNKIRSYFTDYTIRVNEMFEYVLNLSESIPQELHLKQIVTEIEVESKRIFEKYFIINNNHGKTE